MRRKSQEKNLADQRRKEEEYERRRRQEQDQERSLRQQLKDREQELQSKEQELQNLRVQLRKNRNQKVTPVAPPKKTRKILKDLVKQWDRRWAKLRCKDQDIRRQGGTPKDQFMRGKDEKARSKRKWYIEWRSRASMHMKVIGRVRDIVHHQPHTPTLPAGHASQPGRARRGPG